MSFPPARIVTPFLTVPGGSVTRTSASPPLTRSGSDDNTSTLCCSLFPANGAFIVSVLSDPPPHPTSTNVPATVAAQSTPAAEDRRIDFADMSRLLVDAT